MTDKKARPMTTFLVGLIFAATGGAFTVLKSWPDFKMAKESVQSI